VSSQKAVGLYATCAHVETIRSDLGSIFYQCLLSARNPHFPKVSAASCARLSRLRKRSRNGRTGARLKCDAS
jgi:hypothetical protein